MEEADRLDDISPEDLAEGTVQSSVSSLPRIPRLMSLIFCRAPRGFASICRAFLQPRAQGRPNLLSPRPHQLDSGLRDQPSYPARDRVAGFPECRTPQSMYCMATSIDR
jgi:hypothetical protein